MISNVSSAACRTRWPAQSSIARCSRLGHRASSRVRVAAGNPAERATIALYECSALLIGWIPSACRKSCYQSDGLEGSCRYGGK